MKLSVVIQKLQTVAAQKPQADFDFVHKRDGYGFEVTGIDWSEEHQRLEIVLTDEPVRCGSFCTERGCDDGVDYEHNQDI